LTPLQVFIDVRLVTRQKRELRGAQHVFGGMFKELRAAKALNESPGLPVGAEKGKIFVRGVEIRVFLRLAPLQF